MRNLIPLDNVLVIFEQDLGAYKSAVNRGDFELANTFANRMMSNAYMFDEKEIGIIGLILKEMSREGMIAKQVKDKSAPNTVITQTQNTIKKIEDQIKIKKFDLDEIWKGFSNLLVTTRKSKLNQDENVAYSNLNLEFTEFACEKMTKEFSDNLQLLDYPSNNLFGGVLTELGRIMDCHGIEKNSLQTMLILTMLNRLYEYIRFTTNDDLDKRVQDEFIPHVTKALDYLKSNKNETESMEINNILWDLIKIWRIYFIKFTEVRPNLAMRKSSLKEQTKSRIADALSKSLEKEITGETE